MNHYKDYTQKIRKYALQIINIIVGDDISPKLNHYIQLLDNLKINHDSYQEYYGEVKKIVNSFLIHWTEVLNRAIKDADEFYNVIDKEKMILSVDKTIQLQKMKQIVFEESFLPVNSQEEKVIYDEILVLYDNYLTALNELKLTLSKMRDPKTIENFIRDNLAISLRKKNHIFSLTHTYIAAMLLNKVGDIRVSLEEIEHRVRNNLRDMQRRRDVELAGMLGQLYDKNKRYLAVNRESRRNSVEITEVQLSMEKLKKKIENYRETIPSRLEEEAKYWKEKLKEFNCIAKAANDLKEAEKIALQQQNSYLQLRDVNIPKWKKKCWEHMEKVLLTKVEQLEEKKKEAGRSLISFFSIRGPDHIFYVDSIGRFYLDEHGHKVYSYDYGLNMYHVNCKGELYKAPNNEAYYYDKNGRYVLDENGEKVYKIAPCTSSYRLVDDVMTKCTIDCGHSERANKECMMQIRDYRNDPLLPDAKPVDIKGLLNSETTLYLWESFGHVLPEVLSQIANEEPKNPIHSLAHKLLSYKYNKTAKEMEQKKEEARKYRDTIYKDRKDKLITAAKAWKAKQVKRRKPEESDDTYSKAYDAYVANQDFVISLANMYGLL